MKRLIIILSCFVICLSCDKKRKQTLSERDFKKDSLDIILKKYDDTKNLPGFSVSIFNKDSVLYAKSFGYSDLEHKTQYNNKTVQGIASISKTFIAVALMKTIEKGLLRLDDSINTYLPYKVSNPHFPDLPITIRHLATHTSGFDDPSGGQGNIFSKDLKKENWRDIWHPIIAKYNSNVDLPMDVFLKRMFTNKNNFLDERPGTLYEYSNYGSALLAQIIEIVTKTDYKTLTKKEIFEPLQMQSTGWNYKDVDTINHITYYNDNYKPVPRYSIITYPDGGLFTSTDDLTKFMQEMMRGYYNESDFLSKRSYTEMFSSQSKLLDTNTGLFWDLDQSCCIGHGGNDFGIATMMYLDIRDGIGRIVFTNIDVQQENQEDTFYSIFNETFIY